VCVPKEKLRESSALLNSADTYETNLPRPLPLPNLGSLLHTFLRFKVVGKALCFTLIPSDDAHIDCTPTNIERSQMGLPYPTIEIFAQRLNGPAQSDERSPRAQYSAFDSELI
jgi:hypothetical protein